MVWKNKKIIVTGGAGVIGQELIGELIALGAEVLCIDREPKPEEMASDVNYCKVDIMDMDINIIIDFKPEIIFHLAASFERTEETPEFWDINFRDNIIVSHKIIDAARKTDSLKKFIFASSYLIYSSSLHLFKEPAKAARLLNESDPLATRNLTGAAKYYAEKELDFMNATGAKFVTVSARIFRVYGRGSRDIVSRWIRMALKNEELVVFRKENMFDYIYAGDVARGLMKVAEKVSTNMIINLGSGQSRRIKEVIKLIKRQIPNLKFKEVTENGHFEASCADMSAFSEIIGWRPELTLEEGIKKIIDYEKR
ncbi:MAG: NAD-dependent epimerase/dehydratase family protein [Candidatus Cloacimonetes bacterium]|nr:NAD-dependent epimerase/dehydratase family protein [Candidatus Cloacimonadota bacterium]